MNYCVSQTFIPATKYLRKQPKGRRINFWIIVSVQHGGEGLAEQSSSHQGSQETERENACISWLSPFHIFIPSGHPVYGWCHTHSGWFSSLS